MMEISKQEREYRSVRDSSQHAMDRSTGDARVMENLIPTHNIKKKSSFTRSLFSKKIFQNTLHVIFLTVWIAKELRTACNHPLFATADYVQIYDNTSQGHSENNIDRNKPGLTQGPGQQFHCSRTLSWGPSVSCCSYIPSSTLEQ